MMNRTRIKKTILTILTVSFIGAILMIGFDYYACSLYCKRIASFFNDTVDRSSDAVVVFFGDHDKKLELGGETIRRLSHAAALYGSGKTSNIVCTGGRGLLRLRCVSGAELMKNYLVAAGISPDHIFAESESYDSLSNWEHSLAIIAVNRWKRITLVSSALHLYRLAGIVHGDSLAISYSPYPAGGISSFRDYLARRYWIHHEWMAYAAITVLPQKWYRWALGVMRR